MEIDRGRRIDPIRFGIPQLDELFHVDPEREQRDSENTLSTATSLTILGQDGTGKSVFALHAAAQYVLTALTTRPDERTPLVLYLSTDLRFEAASGIWNSFKLGFPYQRYVPFIGEYDLQVRMRRKRDNEPLLLVNLRHYAPLARGGASGSILADYVVGGRSPSEARDGVLEADVAFVDLARDTTGDDWLFAARLLASLPARPKGRPNFLVLDSVAGFETLVGVRNSFGEEMSRRSRIAQLVRAAGSNWHTLFVVEESELANGHQPEEYVSDTVIHLRRSLDGKTERRTIEIEKSRGGAFGAGRHPFELRDGAGSSTGSWENADDPRTLIHSTDAEQIARIEAWKSSRSASAAPATDPAVLPSDERTQSALTERCNSYVQVFHSLDHLNRLFSAQSTEAGHHDAEGGQVDGEELARGPYEPVGIPYLDEMLGASVKEPRVFGLPPGSVSALIGEGGTKKEALAEQFLLHPYANLPRVFAFAICLATQWLEQLDEKSALDINAVIRDPKHARRAWDDSGRDKDQPLQTHLLTRASTWLDEFPERRAELTKLAVDSADWALPQETRRFAPPLIGRWDVFKYLEERAAGPRSELWERKIIIALTILRMSAGLVQPTVMITTHDKNAEGLATRVLDRCDKRLEEVLARLHIVLLGNEAEAARRFRLIRCSLARVVQRNMLVRRIDAMNLSGAEIWHIISQQIVHARVAFGWSRGVARKLGNATGDSRSSSIRVVIGDLRLLRDIYPSVANDSLFLATLIFRLHRYGVTSLIVDSDHGRPDLAPTHAHSWALRSLVDRQILTWKVPFFGEQRVAVTVNPPSMIGASGVIRELVNRASGMASSDMGNDTIDVDPAFELFSGLEAGQPERIPLKLVLYRETPAFEEYADAERAFLSRVFAGLDADVSMLEVLDTSHYQALRDYCQMPVSTKLPYTLVFAVDGFWALGKDAALKNQTSYLFDYLAPRSGMPRFDDGLLPQARAGDLLRTRHAYQQDMFDLFPSPDGPTNRHSHFDVRAHDRRTSHYRSRIPPADPHIDRVPFTWDFGFMLCDERLWTSSREIPLTARDPTQEDGKRLTVGQVWDGLHRLSALDRNSKDEEHAPAGAQSDGVRTHRPRSDAPNIGWREFLEACAVIAIAEKRRRKDGVVPFDLAVSLPDAFLCALFEIWFSEIVADANRVAEASRFVRETGATPAHPELQELLVFADAWCAGVRRFLGSISAECYTPVESETRSTPLVVIVDLLRSDPRAAENGRESPEDRDDSLENRFGKAKCALHDEQSLDGLMAAHLPASKDESVRRLLSTKLKVLRLHRTFESTGYTLQLYKAWLLLLEVLDFDRLVQSKPDGRLATDLQPNPQAVAARHWYKTAANALRQESEMRSHASKVPVRLPGHFSTRGDWFLAVAKGSRSFRLGDMALDILTSRRANRARLARGIGLPTRRIVDPPALDATRTAISVCTPDGDKNVLYDRLLHLAGDFALPDAKPSATSFYWLFRSGLRDYDVQATVLRDWSYRLLSWTQAYRMQHRSSWVGGGGFVPYDDLVAGRLEKVKEFDSFVTFPKRLDYLVKELTAASLHIVGTRKDGAAVSSRGCSDRQGVHTDSDGGP